MVDAAHANAERLGYSHLHDAAMGPLPVTALTVSLDAMIYIAPRESLSLDEEIGADGLVTLEIIY
jgi:hypothetical protein